MTGYLPIGVLVLQLVAACGLAPSSATQGPPVGDGTAPWAEIGGTTMCLGDTALAPPEDPVGGFCLSPLTPDTHACSADAECRSREACVCGKCVVPYCLANSDCPDGRLCDFTTNRCDHACTADGEPDCAADEECIAGACRGRCATSTECQHGEVCDRTHTCITDNCVDASECFPGETCEVQRVPRQVREPAPLYDGGPIVLYFDMASPAAPDARDIWRATSTDARHFVIDPQAPVVIDARAPSPVAHDLGAVTLYYERGGQILSGDSTDGVVFTGEVVDIAAGTSPAVIQLPQRGSNTEGAGFALYYLRPDGTFGLALGSPGQFFPATSVLAPSDVDVGDPAIPDSAFWTQVTKLASPAAILAGPEGSGPEAAGATIHLYFSAFGHESGQAIKHGMPEDIPPNFSVGFAAAPPDAPGALAVWPFGPVVDHVEAFTEHHDELDPAAVRTATGWRLYYIDATRDPNVGQDGPFHLGRLVVLGAGQ